MQFTVWAEGNPNRWVMVKSDLNDGQFRLCWMAVLAALNEHESGIDPTKGSRHYHAKDVISKWVKGRRLAVTIGRHLFYNNVK
jgi:hypothetical protein